MNRFHFPLWRWAASAVLLLSVCALVCAWWFNVWTWRDIRDYYLMSGDCPSVWRDLHYGRIRAGQDVEQVIMQTKPVRVERTGPFVTLSYQGGQGGLPFSGVTIVAREGELVAATAWSCTFSRVFFNTLSDDDCREADEAYQRARRAQARP